MKDFFAVMTKRRMAYVVGETREFDNICIDIHGSSAEKHFRVIDANCDRLRDLGDFK